MTSDPIETRIISASPYWSALVAGDAERADAILRTLGGAAASPPQSGFYRRRLVRNGPWRAARIWTVEHRLCETGELIADIEYHAELDGKETDPFEQWSWLIGRAIPKSEYDFLRADGAWQERAGVSGHKPIDWLTVPVKF